MLLLILTLAITIAGLIAIELGQAPRPRRITVWRDDIERRFLRVHAGPSDRW